MSSANTSSAAELFELVYPGKNYYAASPKKQRTFRVAAELYEQHILRRERANNK